MKTVILFLMLCICGINAYGAKQNCSYFKNTKNWRGNLSAGDSKNPKTVKVIFLQQKQAWQKMTLHYSYQGKVYQVDLKGNCFTAHDSDVTIKAVSQDKLATVVLFISYQKNTEKLDIGTGMVRYRTGQKKQWQSLGGLQGLLKPVKLSKVLP